MPERSFWLKHVLPALGLFIFALWCGTQKNLLFALTGFLGAFVIGVSLIIEGWKKYRNSSKNCEKNL